MLLARSSLSRLGGVSSHSLSRHAAAMNLVSSKSVHTEAKLKELGITLPEVIAAKGNYMSFVRSGNMLFLAGKN